MGWGKSEKGIHKDGAGKWVERDSRSSRRGEKPSAPEQWKPGAKNTKPSPPQPHSHK